MTIEEKRNIIKKNLEKNFLFVSPQIIKGGAKLISDLETLELYEKMEENTNKFAENIILNLITKAERSNSVEQELLRFNFIFCGDFKDLPNDLGSFPEFILNNKEKIVAIHKYITKTERKGFLIGFEQYETINHYGYTLIKLDDMLKKFNENGIEFKIDKNPDRNTPSSYRDDTETRVYVSYNPVKEEKNDGPKLVKKRKESQ